MDALSQLSNPIVMILMGGIVVAAFVAFCCVRYIPNNKVGIVEKLWSATGSLSDGEIIALDGKAGYQAQILRGGVHFGLWRWQFAVHKVPLVTIRQGKIGYVFAKDGEPLGSGQTLGRVIDEGHVYQDAVGFLTHGGQKGRQRAILREGVYALNLALFDVITEDRVYAQGGQKSLVDWQKSLQEIEAFSPIVVSGDEDRIGIVTCHDGPSLDDGEIIAPSVGTHKDDPDFHNNFQDIEAFLRAGGRRGRQYATLIDGTYFINRWFATVELIPKKVVPIGYVGVVVSYYGKTGSDLSGTTFRHGERVKEGERGVWQKPLGPGKYPFNQYAGNVVLVPTTNFVLHWITGRSEGHKYDESLRSVELVTKDAYEPTLPLSVVVHIDYERAPSVIQRFGDVKQLITQTLDPMLSAFFRDVAHRKSMLELIHDRDLIQQEAREELQRKFADFDIACVDVLIGKPETAADDGKIEGLLDQLRQRQLATEQIVTYSKQEEAAGKLQSLNAAKAKSDIQAELSRSKVQVEIAENAGDANLAKARKAAEQLVVMAKAEAEKRALEGEGESKKIGQIGLAESQVLLQKVNSFGDARLYAMSMIANILSRSKQPLVPAQLFVSGEQEAGVLNVLLKLLTAEKIGFNLENAKQILSTETEQRVQS